MNRGSTGLVLVAAAGILLGMGGCEWKDDTGFVEIRKGASVSLSGDDTLVLNSTDIPSLGQKDHLIIQEPVGATTLQLKRGEKSLKLCDVVIRKNRVVTVILSSVNTVLRCSVQT